MSSRYSAASWSGLGGLQMSFLIAVPDELAAATSSLSDLGSSIRAANAAAAGSTRQVAAAAQDEVSAAIAALFGDVGQEYQALGARVSLFHYQVVQSVYGSGFAYMVG